MNKDAESENSTVEQYYNQLTRWVEYYIFFCFIAITVIPLLDYPWVQGVTKFIYFTGFPLLIILILVSMIKDAFIDMLKRRFESSATNQPNPLKGKS